MKRILAGMLAVLLLAAMLPMAAMAASDVTVYVNVTENGALALDEISGEAMIAVPVTVPRGSTVAEVLLALHAQACAAGPSGFGTASMEMFGQKSSYISRWFGETLEFGDGSVNVAAWRNHSMSSTLDSTVRDGDVVDVCVYTIVSSSGYSYSYYGLSWMDYYAVEVGVDEGFTVGVWRSSMDMTTYQYQEEPCAGMQVSVNGAPTTARVLSDGSLNLRFDAPGTYYVTVGGDTAYGTAAMKVTVSEGASFAGYTVKGPGRLAASGLDGESGGEPITVYVTATDCGDYGISPLDGSKLIAVPVTVPLGATVDDVLDAFHGLVCPEGQLGYASGVVEMFGTESCYISRWLGENADSSQGAEYAAAAWLNRDRQSSLASPVSDGDQVTAIRYRMKDAAMFQFEYYGLSYFDHPQGEAAPGEEVTLHAYGEFSSGFMGTEFHTAPLSGYRILVNGEDTGLSTDAGGAVKLRFEEPGVYDVLATGGSDAAAAAMHLTVREGASFSAEAGLVDMGELLAGNLSAPGHGSGADVTVYVTVTDKGGYAKSDVDGAYLVSVPVTVPGGSTVDDVLQAFHGRASAAGALGYSSSRMELWGTTMYAIGSWFGRAVDSSDGSDYAVTAWLNRDAQSTLASRVQDGDVVDAVIYGIQSNVAMSYRYWGLAFFDYSRVTAGVNDAVTLKAYHTVMDPQSYRWNTYVSTDLKIYVNGEARSETVGADGTVELRFEKPGTYDVLAAPSGDGYPAAAARITVEEGASFADSAPATQPTAVVKQSAGKADYGKLLKYLAAVAAAVILILSVIRAVKEGTQPEEGQADAPKLKGKGNARVASVEFWRFAFTVLVCMYHLEIYFSKGKLFPSGTSAVEFFFVLSGFLLALSAGHHFARKPEALSPKEAAAKATAFIWKKVKAIFPILLMTLILHIAINGGGYARKDWLDAALNSEWELLFMVGTPFGYQNGMAPIVPLWFLTALFVAGYIYCYALYRNFHFTLFLAPVLGVVLYSYFTLNSSLVLDFYAKMGLMPAGMVKGFAEMALGMSLYRLYDAISKKRLGRPWRVVLTALMLYSIFRYFQLTVHAAVGLDNFRRIIYIMIIILLSFLNLDEITRLLNGGLARLLGSISMTMYVCHYTLCNLYFTLAGKLATARPGVAFFQGLAGTGGYGSMGGEITWKVRICYILFVMAVAIVLTLLAKLLRKLLALAKKPAAVPEIAESAKH